MHYSLNKPLKLPIRCWNLNKFACKYRFYWLSEGVPLFKLNRCRWFPRAIIQHSVNMFHFIYDPAGCFSNYLPWDLCAFCRHEVCCGHCSQGDGIVIGSLVSHNAYRLHIPTDCIFVRAAKYWPISLSIPALAISSLQIASAS